MTLIALLAQKINPNLKIYSLPLNGPPSGPIFGLVLRPQTNWRQVNFPARANKIKI